MKFFFSIFLFILSSVCFSQNDKPEREADIIKYALDGKSFEYMTIPKTSYFVMDKVLSIMINEKINLEVEMKNDSIISMKTVKENLNPKRTIVIELIQNANGYVSKNMEFKITNPFEKTLSYTANIFNVKQQKWRSEKLSTLAQSKSNIKYEEVILSIWVKDLKLN